ncbi:MAG: FAD-binding oxidoreductase [Patescibacteria group bacterium]
MKESLHYDLIVIGAGFAGLSAAYHFGLMGKRVLVLEKGSGKENASFASTAEMNHDPDANWNMVMQTHGYDAARDLWKLTERSLTLLTDFAHREGAENFETKRVPAHMFSYGDLGDEYLNEKFEIYTKLGANVSRSYAPNTPHPSFTSALTLLGDGRTNNQAILRTLARVVRAQGNRVMRHTEVVSVNATSGTVHVTTANGTVYRASRALVATGMHTISGLRSFPIEPHRTFVVRYENHHMPEPFRSAIMWDVHEPFHYIRSFAGHQLWIGGEDMPEHQVTKEREERAYKRLHEFSKEILKLGEKYTSTGSWSGTFFPTKRSLPYIANDPNFPISYSVGFGGSGLLMSLVSGYLHAAWESGKELHYKKLFVLD